MSMTPSPAAALEAAYTQIAATSMADMPLSHPRVEVEAVGFRRHEAWWVGVIITPWCMNVMLLPADTTPPAAFAAGLVALPGAELPFMPGKLAGVGDYLMCSLFSPLPDFDSHATARATAEAVLAELFPPPAPPGPDLSRRRLFGLGRG
ncbi:[NiFe]-hydrogenase assembly chaperone HybE [Crenobacter caeni]|uniref:[NiFe]-hydrogenase assembly chaperone HybE n=1 Tax=Crenobacter caeni TaxID=2705474 RepID=A0A6B2KUZ6_9NEIS|nr:[NiFe]-hydrogenase assembly chaperone HybE [Crenobacter caeni]NDV13981.1 [NiFe]-hydrogenase assembly chaperone HybE [Crenobacter caeni]